MNLQTTETLSVNVRYWRFCDFLSSFKIFTPFKSFIGIPCNTDTQRGPYCHAQRPIATAELLWVTSKEGVMKSLNQLSILPPTDLIIMLINLFFPFRDCNKG